MESGTSHNYAHYHPRENNQPPEQVLNQRQTHHTTYPSSLGSSNDHMRGSPPAETFLHNQQFNNDDFKILPHPNFICDKCIKISDTCYFCYAKPCNFVKKIDQFHLYNQPNDLKIDDIIEHCDEDYIYEENVDNFNKIYDPYVTRSSIADNYNNKGKRIKKDHPGFCKYCLLSDDKWDANFYERNNSRYRGHMINTHGIHPTGKRAKLPTSGTMCYKWVRNHWFETSGFYCPYNYCHEAFAIGEKSHGFHEYLRHWSKVHLDDNDNDNHCGDDNNGPNQNQNQNQNSSDDGDRDTNAIERAQNILEFGSASGNHHRYFVTNNSSITNND